MSKKTTAVFLTGAAARISQEVAILDKLMSCKGLVLSQDDTLVAGFSSGALNVTAINSCFRKKSAIDWNKYYKKELLFPLRNNKVYRLNIPPKSLSIFNTKPLRNMVNKFLATMNYEWFEDFPFQTYILTYSHKAKDEHTQWAFSLDKGQGNLNISDLLMASTAIPGLFPTQKISSKASQPRNFPTGEFSDGGIAGNFKYFQSHLDNYIEMNGPLEIMHVISPMRQNPDEELSNFADSLQKEKLTITLENKFKEILSEINMNNFLEFLIALQAWNKNNNKIRHVYVSIPEMDCNFPIINFNLQAQQYYTTKYWFELNPDKLAVPLDEFIKKHPVKITRSK